MSRQRLDDETLDMMLGRLEELYEEFEILVAEMDVHRNTYSALGGLGREMAIVMQEIVQIENVLD